MFECNSNGWEDKLGGICHLSDPILSSRTKGAKSPVSEGQERFHRNTVSALNLGCYFCQKIL